ncbi:MAG: hypothetical protein AAGA97_06395 [Pseudomonadota bacterium]
MFALHQWNVPGLVLVVTGIDSFGQKFLDPLRVDFTLFVADKDRVGFEKALNLGLGLKTPRCVSF